MRYVDMHCDTLMRLLKHNSESLYDGEGMLSIKDMHAAGQLAQFFAIFFPPKGNGTSQFTMEDDAYFQLLRNGLLDVVENHSDIIQMAYNVDDLLKNETDGKLSAILTVEDGRMVNGSFESLQKMYDYGVRAMALTWNFANCFGYPNSMNPDLMQLGLTEFGKEAIGFMNDLGMLVDVSHLSDGGFYDVASLSKKPFIATHSNCRAIAHHPRNLTDDMIRVLAEHGGVSGINFYSRFLSPDQTCDKSQVADLVRHVKHFIQVGGEDCVALGTDFDGIDCKLEIAHASEMYKLFDALKNEGITERQIDKLASENVMRVLKDAL